MTDFFYISQIYLQNDKHGFYMDCEFWHEVQYIAKRMFRK